MLVELWDTRDLLWASSGHSEGYRDALRRRSKDWKAYEDAVKHKTLPTRRHFIVSFNGNSFNKSSPALLYRITVDSHYWSTSLLKFVKFGSDFGRVMYFLISGTCIHLIDTCLLGLECLLRRIESWSQSMSRVAEQTEVVLTSNSWSFLRPAR